MELNALIEKHVDKETGKLRPNSQSFPVTSIDMFLNILKVWLLYNRGKDQSTTTIGGAEYGQAPLLWVRISNKLFHLNSDSKMSGIIDFYKNKECDWKVISNQRNGKKNKVTNRPDGAGIKGFYFYKFSE